MRVRQLLHLPVMVPVAAVFLIPGYAAPRLAAQTIATGEVAGIVYDSSGGVVPNTSVVLKNLETGDTRTAPSNALGLYRFTFLRPGTYQISATAASLKSDTAQLIVAVGQVQVLNLTLRVAAAKEVIRVTDTVPLLATDNANIATTFSTTQFELLPSPGGDITNIALTAPGVAVAIQSIQSLSGNFSSHGLPSVSNLFTMNGVDIMDPTTNLSNTGTTGLTLGANEVREASVVQNAYEGQYGRQAGAQVNFISKSGANDYHGNMVYTYNGSFMNANDFFNNSSGVPLTRALSHQYAASLGGRIIRDKLFFFADTEGLRFSSPSTAVVAVPSQPLQDYILGTLPAPQVPFYQKAFSLYNGTPGRVRAIAVTNGNGSLQDSRGALGCGKKLTGTPAGGGGIFGTSVSCADAFRTNLSSETSEWVLATRVDYNLSDKQRIFARFKTDQGFLPSTAAAINPIFSAISRQPDYEGHVNHTYVLTPGLVNNFIGSVNYNDYIVSPADLAVAFATFPVRINLPDGGANGSGGITGLGVGTGTYPNGRRMGQLQLVDDVSYSLGNHALKAGLNYRYVRDSDVGNQRYVGGGRFIIKGLNEFAAGIINPASGSNYNQSFTSDSVVHLRLYNIGFYMQDQWAVSPNVKVTAAIRLDVTGNPSCTNHCFARLASPFSSLAKGENIPYNQSIQTGLGHAFYDIESLVAQPRLGVAYRPGWSKNTVLRSGIGLFFDQYPAGFATGMSSLSPNVFLPNVMAGTINSSGPGSAPAIAIAAANVFRGGFSGGTTLAQLQQALAPILFPPPNYTSIPSTLRNPKYVEWNFEVQRQFGAKSVLSLNYVGSSGHDIFLYNQAMNGYADPGSYPNGFGGLPAAAPVPRFDVVTQITNNGYSNYNALAVSLRRGFGYGFQGRLNYTWSHALDNISNGGLVPYGYDSLSVQSNPYDLRSLNYSNADNDIRHNVTADFVWEVPVKFQKRLVNGILGGWSASGKLYARSGTPFSVSNGDISGNLSNFSGTVLADLLDPKGQTSCGRSAIETPCFTTAQFATAGAQTNFGNLPRNSFRGPGYFDLDSSLYKTVRIGELERFTFGASAFNLLNHPNFGTPSGDVSLSGLGLIEYAVHAPGSPYGSYAPTTGRIVVVTGKFLF